MTKEEQQKRVSERDHIVIHKITDTVITKHRDGTEVYAVEIIRQPLVRCKECENSIASVDNSLQCRCWYDSLGFWEEVKADDYCSYGERKESE